MHKEWEQVFAHESGHALMAVIQGTECRGIFFERNSGKFCEIHAPTEHESKAGYLISASGVAGVRLMCPDRDSGEGAAADREDFDAPDAPSFENTVDAAYNILSEHKAILESLVSLLKSRAEGVDCNLSNLPAIGMDGSDKRYLMLVGSEELKAMVRRTAQ